MAMVSPRAQIRHWRCTGGNVIQTGYEKPNSGGNADLPEVEDAGDNDASTTSASSSPIADRLLGTDNEQLDRCRGKDTRGRS